MKDHELKKIPSFTVNHLKLLRAFKIIEVPEDPPYPSSIDVLPDPPLCTVARFVYETL